MGMTSETHNEKLSATKQALNQIRELKRLLRQQDSISHEPIAVVSIGCRFPGGVHDPDSFWKMLTEGRDTVSEVPAGRWGNDNWFDETPGLPGKAYVRDAAFLDQIDLFDAEFFGISPREANWMDPQQRLLLEVAWETLERAGWPPELFQGSTGLFVGSMWNEYSQQGVGVLEDLNAYVATGSSASFLSGRLSYHLGLRGPSLPVDTACSSSLVAVHLACESLRRGECDRALAGGVNVMSSADMTVLMCQMQALSPDGRCKTFDASADGYGRGEGVGMIALRRLSDAKRDGDPILAVIHGSATNHNGSSSGLTVPNAQSQQEVIEQALIRSKVDVNEIQYIEAHGTGTKLGDPTEIRALWSALRNRNRRADLPLMIGSVKTNIGHTEGAAGIAGLIKTILCVQRGSIPPHLHLDKLNPAIESENLPLKIPATNIEWATDQRLAGVSSFGLSGTNCHVIVGNVEQLSPESEDSTADGPQLLLVSAKTTQALAELAARYATFLVDRPEVSLSSFCRLVNTGKTHFSERSAIIAADRQAAIDSLKSLSNQNGQTRLFFDVNAASETSLQNIAEDYLAGKRPTLEANKITSSDLLLTIPTYPFQRKRYWLDQSNTFNQSREDRPGSVKDLIYQKVWRKQPRKRLRFESDLTLDHLVQSAKQRFATSPNVDLLAQYPAAIEALADLACLHIENAFIELGIFWNPQEFVSDIELIDRWGIADDHRRPFLKRLFNLLSERGRVEKSKSEWKFSAIRFSSKTEELAREIVKRFPFAEIEVTITQRCGRKLARFLMGEQDPLELLFPPDDKTTADYYKNSASGQSGNQLLRLIISELVESIPAGNKLRILEVGAGTGGTTAELLPILPDERTEYVFTDISTAFFPEAKEKFAEFDFVRYQRFDLEADLFSQGLQESSYDIVIASNVLHATTDIVACSSSIQRLLVPGGLFLNVEATQPQAWLDITFGLLPGWWQFQDDLRVHPFATSSQWTELLAETGFSEVEALHPLDSPYQAILLAKANPEKRLQHKDSGKHWLLIGEESQATRLSDQLDKLGMSCRILDPNQHGSGKEELYLACEDSPNVVLDLTALSLSETIDEPAFASIKNHILQLVDRVRDIAANNSNFQFWQITRCSDVIDGETCEPMQTMVASFARVLSLEHPSLVGGSIDIPDNINETTALQIIEDILLGGDENQIALRNGWQYVPRLVPAKPIASNKNWEVGPDESYLITGGLGELGQVAMKWLFDQGGRHFVLVSRRMNQSILKEMESWNDRGAVIHCLQADVSDSTSLRNALEAVADLPPIRGVIHAAGISGTGPIGELDEQSLQQSFAAKVQGAWNIHQLSEAFDLRFMISYSSAASVWGGAGQGAYAAANAFLDGLMQWRRQQGLPGTSINWARWSIGLPNKIEHQKMEQIGLPAMEPQAAMNSLLHSLQANFEQAIIADVNWETFKPIYNSHRHRPLLDEIVTAEKDQTQAGSSGSILYQIANLSESERLTEIIRYLQSVVAELLMMDSNPRPETGFFDLGIDSLMAIELRNRLQNELQPSEELSSTIVFDYPSIHELARHLLAVGNVPELQAREPGLITFTSEPVAIIGMGCRFPQASNLEDYWKILTAGVDAVCPLPVNRRRDWTGSGMESEIDSIQAGFLDEIDQFDPLFFGISPREAVAIDPQHRLLLEVGWETFTQAGFKAEQLKGESVGVFVGITSNEYGQLIRESSDDLGMHAVSGTPLNAAAGRLAFTFGLTGPALAIDTACSSSLTAIHEACSSLRSGECEMAFAGGVNLIVRPESMIAYSKANLLAPDGRSKTFDAAANGFGRGEGCGLLLLKRLSDAKRDGNHILSVIRGSAVNQDGASGGLTVPNGPAQQRVIESALRQAHLEPHQVAYLETHGTGTDLGDPIEVQAAANAYAKNRTDHQDLILGAVKANIGHLEAAAGVAGVIKTVLTLQHGKIPKTVHYEKPNSKIPWERLSVRVADSLLDWPENVPRIAGVSAFGVSGTNAHLILECPEELLTNGVLGEVQPSPFHRQRYWPKPKISQRIIASTGFDPLAGELQELATGQRIYHRYWSLNNSPWIADHKLYQTIAIPGSTHVALMSQVVSQNKRNQSIHLKDVQFFEPILLSDRDQNFETQTVISSTDDGKRHIDIYSRQKNSIQDEWIRHASAIVLQDEESDDKKDHIAIDELRERLSELSIDTFFSVFTDRDLELGPALRGIRQLWVGKDEALANIQTPASIRSEANDILIHPAVLDACTQVSGAALWHSEPGETFFAPFQYGHFWLPGKIPDDFYCHVEITSEVTPECQTCTFYIRLRTPEGKLIGEIRDFVIKRAPRSQFLRRIEKRPEDISYEIIWRERPHPRRLKENDFVTGTMLRDALSPIIAALVTEAELTDERLRVWDEIDRLSRGYIVNSLLKLNSLPGRESGWTIPEWIETAGIIPKHHRLFDRLIHILESNHFLQQNGQKYVLGESFDILEMESLVSNFKDRFPHCEFELSLLERCGAQLAEVLNGQTDPLHLLFPESGVSAEDFYRNASSLAIFNQLAAEVIEQIIQRFPENRPLRILEIGAGTGATTSCVLPKLSARQAHYVFSDLSAGFFASAKQKFSKFPFVEYCTLDIEGDPCEQGFKSQEFDLIIASNVVHATSDVNISLQHIRKLLSSHGILILSEGTRPQAWLDLTFGLLDGWWRFHDNVRTDSPLIRFESWRDALLRQSFETVDGFTIGDRTEQTVIVAQADNSRPAEQVRESWLIVDAGFSEIKPLKDELHSRAVATYFVTSESNDQFQDHDVQIDFANPAAWDTLWNQDSFDGILFLAGEHHSRNGLNTSDLQQRIQEQCGGAFHLFQSLLRVSQRPQRGIYFLTKGAEESLQDNASIASGMLCAFANSINLEHPEIPCRCIEIESVGSDPCAILDEIFFSTEEQRVAIRGGTRFVPKLVPVGQEHRSLSFPESGEFELLAGPNQTIDDLLLDRFELSEPGPDEVQVVIDAAGLNFRDIMNVMGIYPGDAGALGGEFAGKVLKLGPNVQHLDVGEEVFGLGAGVFRSKANVDARMLVRRPMSLSPTEAASIPIVFVTCEIAFKLAGLKSGEKVLIHAASGGVGLAAIQMAQRIGATIIATASSTKQEFIRSLGVSHVYDSRSVNFARQIRDEVGEVDVVLNTLTGDGFIEATLSTLATEGRFVELSKRDIWTETQMSETRPDVEYHILAVDQLMWEIPKKVGEILAGLSHRFEIGELVPIRKTIYPIARTRDAFSEMQQARHIGKLVFEMPPISNRSLRYPGTYLITGGLGGLGMLTAQWLIERGAKHLVLNGRSTPSKEIERKIDSWRADGINVCLANGDISERNFVSGLIDDIHQSMPPLRGVFHAAGTLRNGRLENLDWQDFEAVMAAKVHGAMHLHELTKHLPIEMFVLYSSTASIFANSGQANHGVANAFLDQLAQHRRKSGLPALAINWGPWAEVGAAADQGEELQADFQHRGVSWIDPKLGIRVLEEAIVQGFEQLVAVPIDWSKANENLKSVRFKTLIEEVLPQKQTEEISRKRSEVNDLLAKIVGENRRESLLEHVLVEVKRSLHLPTIPTPEQRFSDLGMDSLMAIEIRNRLQTQFEGHVDLPTTIAFDFPTAQILADQLDQLLPQQFVETSPSTPENSSSDAPSDEQSMKFPLSIEQRALSFSGLPLDAPVFNVPFRIDIRNRIDMKRLQRAWQRLIQRHEMLRVSYPDSQHQVKHSEVSVLFPSTDLSFLPEEEQSKALELLIRQEVETQFDIHEPPLGRLHVIRLHEEHFVLTMILHHLLVDGPSVKLLVGELLQELFQDPENRIDHEPSQSYLAYAGKQNAADLQNESGVTFWKNQIVQIPKFVAPCIKTGEPVDRAGFCPIRIEAEVIEPFEQLCQKYDATLFMGLMSTIQIVMAEKYGLEELTMRSSEASRPPGFDKTIGPFMKTLIFRHQLHLDDPISKLIQNSKEEVLRVYRSATVPLQSALELMSSEEVAALRANVQVTFNMQEKVESRDLNTMIEVQDLRRFRGSSEYGFVFDLTQMGTIVRGHLAYRKNYLKELDASSIVSRLSQLLSEIVKNPEGTVQEIIAGRRELPVR